MSKQCLAVVKNSETIIMTVADSKYLGWLEILLRSLKLFHRGQTRGGHWRKLA